MAHDTCVAEVTNTERRLRRVLDDQERERSYLARRLHEQFAQSLAVVLLGLDRLEREVPTPHTERLAALREHVAETLSLCTELAAGLRPAVLDELGLAPALESLAQRVDAGSFSVDPAIATVRLEPALETHVYRAVQEALDAVSARCTLILRLAAGGQALWLSIQAADDPAEIGDLTRIEARMELIEGALSVGSHGLVIRIPLPQAEAGAISVFPQRRRVETPDGARPAVP